MPETHLTFKCLGHTRLDKNLVDYYQLEVTDTRNDRVEFIDIKPDHLASARSMKRILLSRCMFYASTQKRHCETLRAMFDVMDSQTKTLSPDRVSHLTKA